MSSDIVMIANKSYTIKQSMSDKARRRKYFLTYNGSETPSSNATLTEDETRLLDDLGIDSKMMMSLKFYLSTFFDTLYMCNSDSSLVLRKDCNIPYYVLWSIMVANKEATDTRIRANKESKYISRNIDVAMTDALLHNMEGKQITDPVDKLFQFILTTSHSPLPPTSAINSLFKMPTNEVEVDVENTDSETKPNTKEVLTNKTVKMDTEMETEDELIQHLFTLILTNNQQTEMNENESDPGQATQLDETLYDGITATELGTKLTQLYNKRQKIPLYTFSQHDTTCTTDTLFTILLQADKLRDIFIKNAVSIFEDKMFWGPLVYAMRRYIHMLELETSQPSESGVRRLSINKTFQYGVIAHQNTKRMAGEYCVGATREAMLKYLAQLKKDLVDKSMIKDAAQFDFFKGSEFKTNYVSPASNLNNIKGIYISHPGSSAMELGHVTGFVKINKHWYFSDNEIGLLHELNDPVLIPLLMYTISKSNENDTIFNMIYVRHNMEYRTLSNLRYQFQFTLEDGSFYKYPNNPDVFTDISKDDIVSPGVTSSRIILLTSDDSDRDAILDKAQVLFTTPGVSDLQFVDKMKVNPMLNELTTMGL